MAQKNLEIVEKANKPTDPDAAESLFILDALLQLVSMQCQANKDKIYNDEIAANIARMERICGENGVVDGTQMLHSAYTMQCRNLIREEKIKEAVKILEETYES